MHLCILIKGRQGISILKVYYFFPLKDTTCLYLSPSNKATSLSTLIAVSVNKDTEHKG